MSFQDLPGVMIEAVVAACETDADAANVSASSSAARSAAVMDMDRRRILRSARAKGARYAEMLRLSAEYEAIPERERFHDCAPTGSMSWTRIDTGAGLCPGILIVPSYSLFAHAQRIQNDWFALLAVGDALAPDWNQHDGGTVGQKSEYGGNQALFGGVRPTICNLYPTSRVLVPPMTDVVVT